VLKLGAALRGSEGEGDCVGFRREALVGFSWFVVRTIHLVRHSINRVSEFRKMTEASKGAGSSCLTLAGPDSGSDHQIELPKSLARYATTMIVLIGLRLAIAIYYPH
jgi:hypothetical protein